MKKKLGKPEPDADVVNQQPKVLIVGYGWVGQYIGKYFTNADYVEKEGKIRRVKDNKKAKAKIYDMAVICVPTPMDKKSGECDVSIVDQVVHEYKTIVKYFLIKSTVEIGTTDKLMDKHKVDIAMSPEYIGETLGHPMLEPKRDAFQIIGGKPKTTDIIASYWSKVLNANAPIYQCTAKEAEIIKYCENYWIMRRVDYWNDVYDICETHNQSFNKVREGLVLDPRLNRTHSFVYKNNRGWSGKCLPKDMNALAFNMIEHGRPLKTLEHLINKNAGHWRKDYEDEQQLTPEEKEY
jgi:UDPglucose 6-dehydrogenase